MKRLILTATLVACAAFAGQALAAGNAAAGQKIVANKCAACHGKDGNSTSPQFPRLAGQYADYIEHALHAYQSGARKNAIMNGMAAGLSDQQIKDVAAWFSSQTGLSTVEYKTWDANHGGR
ncbi:MAG TPA: cytochrome c [Gammaproteobacteria bacterium]|nr:cytochrome c [Gammaproteobacteria bacterium]